MNPTGVPIGFQESNEWTFPPSEGAIPVPCLPTQPFPRTTLPPLSISSENQPSSSDVGTQGQATAKKRSKWTEEEHRNFLRGIEMFGKSRCTLISRRLVKTKTPSEVASHAQKHFIRQNLPEDKRKRHSIHDITTMAVIRILQQQPQPHHVASQTEPPTLVLPQQPQHFTAPTAQSTTIMESQKHYSRQNLAPDERKRTSIHDNIVSNIISIPQEQPQQLPVASPIKPPTPFLQEQPQHSNASTAQLAASVESQDFPSTPSSAPVESQDFPSTPSAWVPENVDQSDALLYLPRWEWAVRYD